MSIFLLIWGRIVRQNAPRVKRPRRGAERGGGLGARNPAVGHFRGGADGVLADFPGRPMIGLDLFRARTDDNLGRESHSKEVPA
jgi:hypothetical protein